MKKAIALALSILSSSVLADPTVFGMELGITTEKEVKTMYPVEQTGTNEYNGGNVYSIPVEKITFRGLTEVTAVFNQQGYLVAVLNKLTKRSFDSLNQSFSKSYTLISEDNPFVGNKSAIYREGGTEITLNALHNNADMELNYIKDELATAMKGKSEAEEKMSD